MSVEPLAHPPTRTYHGGVSSLPCKVPYTWAPTSWFDPSLPLPAELIRDFPLHRWLLASACCRIFVFNRFVIPTTFLSQSLLSSCGALVVTVIKIVLFSLPPCPFALGVAVAFLICLILFSRYISSKGFAVKAVP